MIWLLRLIALVAAVYLLRPLAAWFVRAGWRRLFSYSVERMSRAAAPPARHGTMKRDPVCGTHVDVELAVRESDGGGVAYFCSERCRDAYRARSERARQAVGAQHPQ